MTPPAAPSSLRRLLRRTYLTLTLGAVLIVGLVLVVPTAVILQLDAAHDLRLLARATSHAAEAAVVFNDAEAAQEALESVVRDEDVATARIRTADGRTVAEWHEPPAGWLAGMAEAAASLLPQSPAIATVLHDGTPAGTVEVRGNSHSLLRFLALGALGVLGCQALGAAGAVYFSRRTIRRIARPLQTLIDVTARVQTERAFGRRVPDGGIRELNALGHAFNALLAELDAWHASMESENRRLSHQASHDSLTGLPNRAFFEGRLNRALTETQGPAPPNRVAVMLVDCDDFKQINDIYGHAAGDAVLVAVADRLRGQVRERDLVARLGGDEFAVLVATAQDPAQMHRLASSLAATMSTPVALGDGRTVRGSLSVGFAIFPDHATTPGALMRRADEAMYRAKRGRGTQGDDESDGDGSRPGQEAT